MVKQTGQDGSKKRSGTEKTRPQGKVGLARRLRNYFIAGVLVTAPVGITFWLAWKVIDFVDNRVTPFLPPRWNPEQYLPFSLPGLGLLMAVVFLTLVGFLAAGYAGRAIVRLGERLVGQVPVARSVYSWTKQVFETVLSQQSTAFNEVVLIEYPCRGIWAIGFITGQTEGEVQETTEETVFNVFIPATPNPTTGFLLFIPQRDIQHLDMTVEEGIKLVISGGIVMPPERTPEEAAAIAEAAVTQQRQSSAAEDHSHPGGGRRFEPLKRLRNYFFAGVLVTAPIGITVWIAWGLISFIDNRVMPLIPREWNPETYLPFSLPGLGVVVVVLALVLVGFFAAGLVGRNLVGFGEHMLDRTPVIRSVYAAVKQVVETVLQEQGQAFRQVVLIQYPRKESWAIGFVTGEAENHVQHGTAEAVINVFLPTTPNPTSGFLLFVPRQDTQDLTMTVEEGIKMVVSGGIVTPPDRRQLDQVAEADTDDAEVAKTA